MTRLTRSSPLTALLVAVLLAGCAGTAAAKSYTADRFDVNARLLPDRSLSVEERIVFRFEGGDYTYVFREIRQDRTDGVRDVAADMDGAPFRVGPGAGSIEVKQGRAVRVTWHFPPTSGTHTFTLRYRLAGVVVQEDAESVLAWHVLPREHAYRIGEARALLELPPGVRFTSQPSVEPASAELRVEYAADRQVAERLIIGVPGLGHDASMTLRLRVAAGPFTSDGPVWQREAFERSRRGPWLLIVAGTVLVLGLGWLSAFWSAWGRSTDGPRNARARQATPPDPLMPIAVAARLGGGAAHGPHAVATMVDLAARGVITIDEAPGGRRVGRRFVARLAQEPAGLRPHETAWLDTAFGAGTPRDSEVPLARVQRRFTHVRNAFRRALQEEMRHLGLLDPERIAARRMLVRGAMVALVLALAGSGVAVVLASRFGAWVMVIPVSLAVVAAAFGIAAGSFSTLTRTGERLADQWKAYFAEVRRIAKDKRADDPMPAEWLPYAVAAAVGAAWVRKLAGTPGRYVPPAWFRAASGGDDHSAVFAAFLGTHDASSGAGVTAGAGGGAAAGGGSSGAG